MAACESTLVVSWNEAADTHERVERDAFVLAGGKVWVIFETKTDHVLVSLQSMNKQPITKAQALKAITKLVDTKELIRAYARGEVSIQTLTKKGIKFAKPL